MRYSSKDTFLLIDGFDILGRTTELTYAAEAGTEETTTLGQTVEEHTATGITSTQVTQNGFYDEAELLANEALTGHTGEARALCFGFGGIEFGGLFTGLHGSIQTRVERIATVGGITRANVSYLGSGFAGEGKQILPPTVLTGAGDTKANKVEETATVNGAAVFVQVSGAVYGGYSGIQFKLIGSTNGSTWTDVETLGTITDENGALFVKVAGSIPKHLAVSWIFTGSGSSPAVQAMVGVVRL